MVQNNACTGMYGMEGLSLVFITGMIFLDLKGVIGDVCYYERVMVSLCEELLEIYDEINGWKRMYCAMALHPRLGSLSLLGSVGRDLLTLILKFT